MALAWGRVLRIETAGVLIDDPRIRLELTRDGDDITGQVTVWNLTPATEQAINNEGERVRVSAGHEESVGVVLDGTIRRVTKQRQDLARLLILELGSAAQGAAVLGGVANRSYAGVVSARRVLFDFASDLGLQPGPLDAVPSSVTVENYTWTGSANQGLKDLLGRIGGGLSWWEDDGVLRVNSPGAPQVDVSQVRISAETGMLGSPTPTDEGAEVKTWLQPQAIQGAAVTLQSEVLAGEFKAVSIRHSGDNWEGPWETVWTLRPLGASQ